MMGLIEERQQHRNNKSRAHDVPFHSVLNTIQPITIVDKISAYYGLNQLLLMPQYWYNDHYQYLVMQPCRY